jgi:hypothetical protein
VSSKLQRPKALLTHGSFTQGKHQHNRPSHWLKAGKLVAVLRHRRSKGSCLGVQECHGSQ